MERGIKGPRATLHRAEERVGEERHSVVRTVFCLWKPLVGETLERMAKGVCLNSWVSPNLLI